MYYIGASGAMARFVIAFSFSLALLHIAAARTEPMRKFTVDLDKPPEERWIDILSHYNSSVPAIIKYFDQEVSLIEFSMNRSFFSETVYS